MWGGGAGDENITLKKEGQCNINQVKKANANIYRKSYSME